MTHMANWLFKTEPGDYSFADLERDGRTIWDGVGNNWALQNLRQVRTGDRVLIYHTGKDKAIIGQAKVVSDPYPDPGLDDPKRAVVDIEPVGAWARPVTLSRIKSDPAFADFALVKFSRLSVMPVPRALWTRLEKIGAGHP
jgi:predicted RNA-binding protein with PUA-like domain